MKLAIVPITPFQQTCSLVICPTTNRAAFVDPGGEVDRLFEQLHQRGATVEKVLVTHGHIDHCGGVAEVAERAGVPIEGPHPDENFWIDQLERQGRMFGVPGARHFTPDRRLHDGDEVTVGDMRFEVRHCPGPHAGGMWSSPARSSAWPSSATCCSRARSAAPTSRAATTAR